MAQRITPTRSRRNMPKNKKISYIKHEVNKGKPEALRTGENNSTWDTTIFAADADCTYPAKNIPEFVKKINSGSDMVLGARIFNNTNIPLFNRIREQDLFITDYLLLLHKNTRRPDRIQGDATKSF